jgi:integrase
VHQEVWNHRTNQAQERLLMGSGWIEHQRGPLVFTDPDGSSLHPDRFYRMLIARARAAGLPAIDVHGLRHSYATAALRAGVRSEVLSARLGHADVATTLSVYAHVKPDDDAGAAAVAAAAILSKG